MQASGVVATLELRVRSDVWGGPPAGSRAESVVGGLAPSRNRKLFCFWISQEGIFTSPQNFVNFVNPTRISSDVGLTGHSDSQ